MPELTNDAGAAIVELKEQTRRASAAFTPNLTYTGCGRWSEWISRSTPMSPYGREQEQFSPNDLEILCPSALGNMVNGFRCKDEKGEPIHDKINQTNVDNTFVYTCYNMSATCDVLNLSANSSGAKCPDYAIGINCSCPPITQSPFSGNATNGSTATGTPTRTIFGIDVTSVLEMGSGSSSSGMVSGTGGSEAVTGTSGSGTGGGSSGSGTENGTSGSAVGSGTSDSGTGGGTSGSGTGSGTSGSGTGSGTSGSGTGSETTSGSGTGGGSSGSGTGSGPSGSAAGSGTSGSVPGSGTGGNQSGRYDSFAGSSSADGNFSAGGTSMPWWLIPLVVSLVLFVVNLILVLCVYNKLKMQIGTNQVGPI